MKSNDIISIGELATRTGISVSAIRYYEEKMLIAPFRSSGGQRKFLRSSIRRISFIRIAQQLGLSIDEIAKELKSLPEGRTPTQEDWAKISVKIQSILDEKIAILQRTRNLLNGCIGCGCLSLKNCAIYNKNDRAAIGGNGPRFIEGDKIEI
ncbi:MAG: redox-sensitive transcriptional activator SoxR [Caulobacterales bacterium]|nr:redox-sensitive transcriptional activator SoxR [Caulobacterales bacterium]